MEPKKWYKSKMLWVNAIAFAASFLQYKFGILWDPARQGLILSAINFILRILTKEEIIW